MKTKYYAISDSVRGFMGDDKVFHVTNLKPYLNCIRGGSRNINNSLRMQFWIYGVDDVKVFL